RAIRAEVERLKVERQGGGRIVEVAEIRRGVYLWLLRERRLAYLLHWAEILGPGRACELAGLVEGEEYWVWRPTTGPPSQTEVA
ncbi:hypothetical protein, partial [Deinococcus sp.]|uniref:hypothetical protein n=1 Tax=Deinococcus sp. TaxID=47478 RepID=UPI00391D81D8